VWPEQEKKIPTSLSHFHRKITRITSLLTVEKRACDISSELFSMIRDTCLRDSPCAVACDGTSTVEQNGVIRRL
jgi:hypothetical protein